MTIFFPLQILDFLNNKGITKIEECDKGFISNGRSSLPFELLPKNTIKHKNIPFYIQFNKDNFDNIELNGQSIKFPNVSAKKIHFLGVSSNGSFREKIKFKLKGEIQSEGYLSFSDFLNEEPAFNDEKVLVFNYIHTLSGVYKSIKANIWYNSTNFEEVMQFDEIVFPDNLSMHIFSITTEL
ncbi:hypothetical protein P9B03_09125 [Metasolibacillus meyeri]|uniref:Uncharacterized protein n=1 Tax=Metasolibacillus meyeri TaxID=1071052 RepID=A0AAW9NQ78_9BACL|nr:hypothetical protein [Metasolibacillus meyeri]MEC1178641.1 hypothetical protein [Metasolibacillus meyeri]